MTERTISAEAPTLETLLAEGKVESALILKGDFTNAERDLIQRAWSMGIKQGKEIAFVSGDVARARELAQDALAAQPLDWRLAEIVSLLTPKEEGE